MAANKQQGSYFGLFLAGATVLCAGFAYFDSGTGKALLALGAIVLIGSLFGFMGIKPLEGKTALKPGPEGMKLIGAAVCASVGFSRWPAFTSPTAQEGASFLPCWESGSPWSE